MIQSRMKQAATPRRSGWPLHIEENSWRAVGGCRSGCTPLHLDGATWLPGGPPWRAWWSPRWPTQSSPTTVRPPSTGSRARPAVDQSKRSMERTKHARRLSHCLGQGREVMQTLRVTTGKECGQRKGGHVCTLYSSSEVLLHGMLCPKRDGGRSRRAICQGVPSVVPPRAVPASSFDLCGATMWRAAS